MQRIFIIALLSVSSVCMGQTDSSKWLRAFPVTDYMVDLNDSTKLVQLNMPQGQDAYVNQLGVLYGIYKESANEAVQKGYGRCHLIKERYFYFAIGNNTSGMPVKSGDLLYLSMNKTNIYFGQLPKIAAHFIQLHNVYDTPLYDPYTIFLQWAPVDENNLLDSMVTDIRFTGNYFLKEAPAMNAAVKSGDNKGKKVLDLMMACTKKNVMDFLDYIIARPRLYAGKEWKTAEIFATWLVEGAPKVVK